MYTEVTNACRLCYLYIETFKGFAPNVRGDIQPYMTIKNTQIQVISCNEKRWCPVPAGENSARVQGSDRGESMEGGGEGTRR